MKSGLRRSAGWNLAFGGVLYAAFHGGAIRPDSGSDGPWVLGLATHALTLVLVTWGLVGARRRLQLRVWVSGLWIGSTVMAFLGLTVGHPLWSVAMLGFALSIAVATGRRALPGLLVLGGGLWLGLFIAGARIGDENGRELAGVEPLVALASLLIMGSGLVWLGLIVAHEPEPGGSA